MFYFLFEGKNYLNDASYGLRKGIISHFHGIRCHINEFIEHSLENKKRAI